MTKRRIEDSNELEPDSVTTIKSSDIEDLEASSFHTDRFSDILVDPTDRADEELSPMTEEEQQAGAEHPLLANAPLSISTAFKQELCAAIIDFINKNEKYVRSIKSMCIENRESIEVDYGDIAPVFRAIDSDPTAFLEILDDALTRATQMYFPSYHMIRPMIHGRIVNLPVLENLRDLRNSHLSKLVRVNGIVTRRSGIFSLYSIVKFTCTKCRATFGPFVGKDLKPTTCFECQGSGPFVVNANETIYKDYQRVSVQEVPGTVPSGSLPRSCEVMLCYDLIDSCKPGDEVDLTGVYRNSYSLALNAKNGFPVFSTVIEATSILKKISKTEMTEEDVKEIRALGKHPGITDLLIDSVAPSVYGHRDIKTSILLAMVGGEAKERNGMRIRGDINVLLMGDPGTAKSQFLRYVHKTSHRAVLATGQGSSSVGLTASVRRDPVLNEWTLEGGALVLADNGICLIDEFDKMGEGDRVAIHEAMEQQSISISKAGIVASLHARCAVIAAANPNRGKYNPALSFAQNINLSDPIVSRFDLLCVVKDSIDVAEDTRMANFILSNHQQMAAAAEPANKPTIPQELLKKYILYARSSIHPAIAQIDSKKISHLYSELRKEGFSSGIPITVRHVESIIRISEAYAKLRLSTQVSKADIDAAITLTLGSFLSAQKYSVSKQLRKKFSKYFDENNDDLTIYILKEMATEMLEAIGAQEIQKSEFMARCKTNGISVGERFFTSERFKGEGFALRNEKIERVL